MPPKLLKALIGVAVAVLVVWLWFGQTRWRGKVVDAKGASVEGVTVLLMNGAKVADITATESDGTYSFKVGMRPDPALRIMFCKVMYEPSPLMAHAGSEASKAAKYTLELARADYIDPGVEKILAGLPPECQ